MGGLGVCLGFSHPVYAGGVAAVFIVFDPDSVMLSGTTVLLFQSSDALQYLVVALGRALFGEAFIETLCSFCSRAWE